VLFKKVNNAIFMKRLPTDFEILKYGLKCRLVRESDAEFIVSLRTDPLMCRFINATSNDVEKQREWIRQYKQREAQSQEYYFIYEYDNEPIGVNRIYDMEGDHCTEGSWVCVPLEDSSYTVATSIIMRDIIFDVLDFEYDVFNVSLGNKKVKKYHLISGATILDEDETQFYFRLDKQSYLDNRQWFINTYQLNK